jgi:Domain of unknown function (DUF4123)
MAWFLLQVALLTASDPYRPADGLLVDAIAQVVPLDAQFGQMTRKCVPDALRDVLFGQPEPTEAEHAAFGAQVPPLGTYAVLDAARLPYLLPDILAASGLRHVSLFQGKAQDDLAERAPYLVQLTEDSDLTRRLFTGPQGLGGLWHKELGIFLRGRQGFDALRRDLRKFTYVSDEAGKMWFLRFWDSRIAPDLLQAYFEDGLDRLLKVVTCMIVCTSDTCTVVRAEGQVGQTPFRLSAQGQQRYLALRAARLSDQITRHFLTLPDFAHVPQADLHGYVAYQVGCGRAAGLTSGADLFRYVLGFCLSQDRDALQTAIAGHLSDADASTAARRRSILMQVDAPISQAAGTAQQTGGA